MEHSLHPQQAETARRATVTVLIPAYNAESFLHETLASVLAQTRQADEVLVVDDGSTDGTERIVRAYGDRVRYLYQANQGIAGARNTGVREATSEYIALFDHDDVMLPDKLEKQMALVEKNRDKVMVYSTFSYWYDNGTTKPVPAFSAKKLTATLRYRNPILPSTTILKRSALLEVGGFRDYFGIDDWDLWWRLINRYSGRAFQEIDEALTLYRWHEANTTSTSFLKMSAAILRMTDAGFLDNLNPIARWLWRRRIHSRVFYHTAVRLREIQDDHDWPYALESFVQWPFPTRTLTNHRYKVLLNMLLKRVRQSGFSLSSLLPERNCRQHLEQSFSVARKSI